MAAVTKANLEDSKQATLSPKLKNRENAKDTLCRNVTIYGKCRYEDKGCAFNHKVDKPSMTESMQNDGATKKGGTFNVDSPSFTPSFLAPNDGIKRAGSATISPKAANAAPFLPKTIVQRQINGTTPPVRQDARTPEWTMSDLQEFVPGRMDSSMPGASHDIATSTHTFDTFQANHQPNPYVDHSLNGAAYYQSAASYPQIVQYHQYAPIGPHNTNLSPYQRTVHDLFLSNDTREEIHRKMATTLQTLPNSQLPNHIESYHSLVPLDTIHRKGSSLFGGYTSWIYKAQSSANGHYFALRRIEGYRLTNELAIRSVQSWKTISNPGIVQIVDAFTNRSFGDSSLFIVTDYYPRSKTLAEEHLVGQNRNLRNRSSLDQVPEAVLWTYVTQIASALKAIHNNGLAARVVDTSKILVTGKNRVRLNGCAVLDVIHFDEQKSVTQLQRQDLVNFGLVILSVGANMADAPQNFARAMDQFKRFYKPELQNAVIWLYSAVQNQDKTIDQFVNLISSQVMNGFAAALSVDDSLEQDFAREVENGRLFRLLAKLNFIYDRPDFGPIEKWSERGERFFLKLFRDFLFHRVDAQGQPVVDLAQLLLCLNKLDAGTEERITLITRDDLTCYVVSYRELKKAIESAFQELTTSRRI